MLLQGVPADPKHGHDLGDPETAVGQASSIPLGQACGGPAEGQAGPSAIAVNREKAEPTKEDSHTGKSGGGGAAAAEAGKGKVEKSKSHKAAQAQLVSSILTCILLDPQRHMSCYTGQSVCIYMALSSLSLHTTKLLLRPSRQTMLFHDSSSAIVHCSEWIVCR